MGKDKELKNCPFCDQKPLGPEPADSDWWIECEHCEIIMDGNSKAELIDRWNKRPSNTRMHMDTKPKHHYRHCGAVDHKEDAKYCYLCGGRL